MQIRSATLPDADAVWRILEPMIRAGDTYPLPRRYRATRRWPTGLRQGRRSTSRSWRTRSSALLRATQKGGGAHVANCGYVTASHAAGAAWAARCASTRSCRRPRVAFAMMQFNFVVSSNMRAVRLWQSCGFEIVGRLPEAFRHPTAGLVDALVMSRRLDVA